MFFFCLQILNDLNVMILSIVSCSLLLCHWCFIFLPLFFMSPFFFFRSSFWLINNISDNFNFLFRALFEMIPFGTKANRVFLHIYFKHEGIFFHKGFGVVNDVNDCIDKLIYLPLFLFFGASQSIFKTLFPLYFFKC